LLRERITRNFGRSPQQDGLPLEWTTELTIVKYNNEKRMHMYLYLTRVCGASSQPGSLTFSCFMCLSNLISRKVRFASIWLSNALPIFLMATSSRVCALTAALHVREEDK
jgi:hypothetical protein